MDVATLATALVVVREGSVRNAARVIGRPVSTVGDALERFEAALGLPLAARADNALTLTLTGEALKRASGHLSDLLARMQRLAETGISALPEDALAWAARQGVPLTLLSNFSAVLAEGSIRRVARSRGLSQPQLSRQMSRLEAVFHGPLLLRDAGGCKGSERGLALGDIGLGLEAWLAEFVAPISQRHTAAQKPLRFGVVIPLSYESRLAIRLAAVVAKWSGSGQKSDLLVSSTTAEDLIEGLKVGRYDMALLDTTLSQKQFEDLEVFSSEIVLVGPPRAFEAHLPPERLLAGRSLALPSHRSGLRQCISEALGPMLDRAGRGTTRFVDVDALSIVINLVLEHGYLSILPVDAVKALGRDIAIMPFPDAPRVRFHLVWRRLSTMGRTATQIAAMLTDRAA